MLRGAFPDYRETIEDLIASRDRVVTRLTIRGTHEGPLPFAPATGKSIEIADTSIFRIEDGKIAEQWAVTDQLSLLVQLGQVEAPG
jgi:predicted ester cyclase